MGEEEINHNVIFITLDSCRYDSAVRAATPNLDNIGPLKKAETSGTYTFPAHQSFFLGNIPRPIDGNGIYFANYRQIWRSSAARGTNKAVYQFFDTTYVMDFYKRNGVNVFGYGGVSFFDVTNPLNTLPKLLPDFIYYGDGAELPRKINIFPLNHIQEITNKIPHDEPYFIFINEPATHIPYDSPESDITDQYKIAFEKLCDEHYSDHTEFYEKDKLPLSVEEIDLLKSQQVKSLEWADKQFGELISALPSNSLPTVAVVTSDHGDEFGEHGRFGHAHASDEVMHVPLWSGLIN